MNVIYVDDELPAIQNFRFTVENFSEIKELHTFQNGEEAVQFAQNRAVDVAFLDMEMPGIHGLELAKALKNCVPNMRIIFVTAFSQYALEAFAVDAIGYLLKPYTADDIHKELSKCSYKPLPSHRVVIQTVPGLSITVDGVPLSSLGGKPREMLALLIDKAEQGFTVGECIACLWPERQADSGTQSLYRMTWKRMANALEAAGIGDVLRTSGDRRYLKTEEVDCDLYRILAGNKQAASRYNGIYLQEYAWAEERNAQLYRMVFENN